MKILLAGPIPAQKSLWMIGDDFLQSTSNELFDMKNHPIPEMRILPYIVDNYNVEILTEPVHLLMKSFLGQIDNSIVKGLNEIRPPYIPRYILMVIDKDLIASLGFFDYGVTRAIEDKLKWIIEDINERINDRKKELLELKPGAVSSASEPRVVWIHMIKRPDNSLNKNIYSLATKFNRILEDVIAGDKRSHILKVHLETNNANFDHFGTITPTGLYQYWKIVDETMKDFDLGKTELDPIVKQQNPQSRVEESHHQTKERRQDNRSNYHNQHYNRSTHWGQFKHKNKRRF